MEVGVAGPTYRTSGYIGGFVGLNNGTGATYSGTSTAKWLMTGNEDFGSTEASEGGFLLQVLLSNPALSSTKTTMNGNGDHLGSGHDHAWWYGRYNTAEANTCWKFEFGSGNVNNGKFMQYRRARS